ncbi:hypothetical protein ACJ72_08421 [Emergomyces africanus]|uniref:Uncharacterized protein n=1 Tax=Emergomyces africanus TaxID=1955775 RepID=A0A1B7NKJ2_9EURO|nr:hypothetical protein ACJ72_08421 [Emergomyces africanus]
MAFVLPPTEFVTAPANPPDPVIATHTLSEAKDDDAPSQEKPGTAAEEEHSNVSPERKRNDPAAGEKFDPPEEEQQSNSMDEGNHDREEAHSVRASNNDEISYPEGGLRAWLVVVGSCFGTAVSLGMM